jgi:hypothetical protein
MVGGERRGKGVDPAGKEQNENFDVSGDRVYRGFEILR